MRAVQDFSTSETVVLPNRCAESPPPPAKCTCTITRHERQESRACQVHFAELVPRAVLESGASLAQNPRFPKTAEVLALCELADKLCARRLDDGVERRQVDGLRDGGQRTRRVMSLGLRA